MEFLSRFNFDIKFVEGRLNKVGDCLSRCFENDTFDEVKNYNKSVYVNADVRLDPEGEDLPWGRFAELRGLRSIEPAHETRKSNRIREIRERIEERQLEAEEMELHSKEPIAEVHHEEDKVEGVHEDPSLEEALNFDSLPPLCNHVENTT